MKRIVHIISILLLLSITAFSQQVLTGKVLDAASKKPLAGATIAVQGASGTTTDANGHFTIPCKAAAVVTITYVGYQTQIFTMGDCSETRTIELMPARHHLDEVQIVATSGPNKFTLYTPVSITRLTGSELKRGTGLFLDDAINGNVPGMTMQRRGVSSGQQLNIRGYGNGTRGTRGVSSNFDGQGYKVYLNDIPITDAEGITIMDDIDFASAGNAEVIKGPSGTLYGLSIAGVLALETIRPDKGSRIKQDVLIGSYGLQRYTTHFQMGGESSSLLLNYGRQQSDGFMTHTASEKDFINIATTFQPKKQQRITAYFGYANSYDERGGELTLDEFANRYYSGNPRYIQNDAHSAITSFRAGLGHTWQFNQHISNTTTAFGSSLSSDASSAAGWTDEHALNYGLRSTFATRFAVARNIQFSGITGIETQHQQAQTMGFKMIKDPNDTTTTWTLGKSPYYITGNASSNTATHTGTTSLFTEWTLALPSDFSLTAGLGISRIRIRMDDRFNIATATRPGHYDTVYKDMVSPHIAINKVFSKQFSVYASYSRGYKPPVSSYFFVVIPADGASPVSGKLNGVLKPEKGNQFEAGTKGALFNNLLTYEAAVFQVKYSDKMTAIAVPSPSDPNTTLYSYVVNGGTQNHKGIEALVKLTAVESEHRFIRNLRPYANLTWSDFKYEDFRFQKSVAVTEDYSGNAVAGVPKLLCNLGVDLMTRPGVYATVNYLYKDRMPITSDNNNYAGSYSLLNAKLGIQRNLGPRFRLDAFAGADNLTGTQYAWMTFINQLPDAYIAAPDKPVFYGGVSISCKL